MYAMCYNVVGDVFIVYFVMFTSDICDILNLKHHLCSIKENVLSSCDKCSLTKFYPSISMRGLVSKGLL